MKIISLHIFLFHFIFFSPGVIAQEIDWDKICFGGSVQFSVTDGDLNKYWGNFFAPGILLQYQPGEDFIFEAAVSGSYLQPAKKNESKFPNIVVINSLGMLKYNIISKKNFNINVSPGFTNTAFVFTGEAADKLDDNFIEYEFGVYFSSGLEFAVADGFSVEFLLGVQNIFSLPFNLVLYTSGLKFIFK